MMTSDNAQEHGPLTDIRLRKLTVKQAQQIDQLLASLGEYGEIRLIVERGELKYINMIENHKVGGNRLEDEN